MTNHIKEEQFLYDRSRKDQHREEAQKCQWGTIKGTNLKGILTW